MCGCFLVVLCAVVGSAVPGDCERRWLAGLLSPRSRIPQPRYLPDTVSQGKPWPWTEPLQPRPHPICLSECLCMPALMAKVMDTGSDAGSTVQTGPDGVGE